MYAAEYVHTAFPGKQHPLLDDYNDIDENGEYPIGHSYIETDYFDHNDPEKDGYLAANTFL